MEKTIAHVTDAHLDESYPLEMGVNPRKNWKVILADISSRQIDEIIMGGDIGTHSSNEWFFNSLNSYTKNLNVTLGNHDSYQEVQKYYTNTLIEGSNEWYYCYEDHPYTYIFLDSSSGKVSASQLAWLESRLHITEKRIIVFIHHPILPVNTFVDGEFPLTNRDDVKEILFTHKQKVTIFCGHYHMKDETRAKNIRQYITPASSYQFDKEAQTLTVDKETFGYRIIHNSNDQLKTDVVLFDTKATTL